MARRRAASSRSASATAAFLVRPAQASAGGEREALPEVAGEAAPERDRKRVPQERAKAAVATARREAVAVVHEQALARVRLLVAVHHHRRAEFVREERAVPRVVVAREDDEAPARVHPLGERAAEAQRQARHERAVLHPRLEHVADEKQALGVRVRIEQARERPCRRVLVGEATAAEVEVGGEQEHRRARAGRMEVRRKDRHQRPASHVDPCTSPM